MTTKFWLCATALFVPALAGCGGSSSSSPAAPMLTPHSVSTTMPNGLTATLTEDRSAVSVGGTVNYTATLTNPTAQPITYQYMIGPGSFTNNVGATLFVTDHAGNQVFLFSSPVLVGGTSGPTTLAPGQSVSSATAVSTSGSTVSPVYAASGHYTANASFLIISGTAPSAVRLTATVGPLTVTAQ